MVPLFCRVTGTATVPLDMVTAMAPPEALMAPPLSTVPVPALNVCAPVVVPFWIGLGPGLNCATTMFADRKRDAMASAEEFLMRCFRLHESRSQDLVRKSCNKSVTRAPPTGGTPACSRTLSELWRPINLEKWDGTAPVPPTIEGKKPGPRRCRLPQACREPARCIGPVEWLLLRRLP